MPVESAAAVETPAAQPRFISAGDRPLFVWYHSPASQVRRGAAIVLCPALGYEYMSAYRTWRILAERLARLGFSVLRLDYDGTGNSAGNYEEPGRFAAWLKSISFAIAEARRLSGSNAVALGGLRAGALLALQAAADRGGVDRLALWSAFPSGRAYVRELEAFARLSRQDHTGDEDDARAINAAGHVLTAETLEALARWTPEAIVAAPAQDVLLVDRDDRPGDRALEKGLSMLGSRVTSIRAAGTAEMLAPPHFATVPERALDQIVDWFHQWRVPVSSTPSPPTDTDDAVTMTPAGRCQERAVRFGPGNRLFGFLAAPTDERTAVPSIVLLNTGVEHHVGPHRLYVPLAREWARGGHVVLRFDLGGLGDSAPPPGVNENIAYPAHMLDDAREAIAFVRTKAPNRTVIAAGLCSGGWLAFQAARHGLDVDAIISVNPPMYLREPDAGARWLCEMREVDRYRESMRDPSKWVKALSGGAAYAIFAQITAIALARRIASRVSTFFGGPTPEGLARDLRTISDRGIASLFVFSRGDEGLRYFRQFGPPALLRARTRGPIRHVVVEGAGHSFVPRAAQQTLLTLLADFVRSQRHL